MEDCYFFIDGEKPEDQRAMSVLCVPCRNKVYPGIGWFWEGSKNGYGPWNYICSVCGKKLNEEHKTPNKDSRK